MSFHCKLILLYVTKIMIFSLRRAKLITILVVDDHELVRTGICRMLEDHADVQVIGQAESGEEAIALVRQLHLM